MRASGTKSPPSEDGSPRAGREAGEASAKDGSRFAMAELRRGDHENPGAGRHDTARTRRNPDPDSTRASGTKSPPSEDGYPRAERAAGEASACGGPRFAMAEPRRGSREIPAPDAFRRDASAGVGSGIP